MSSASLPFILTQIVKKESLLFQTAENGTKKEVHRQLCAHFQNLHEVLSNNPPTNDIDFAMPHLVKCSTRLFARESIKNDTVLVKNIMECTTLVLDSSVTTSTTTSFVDLLVTLSVYLESTRSQTGLTAGEEGVQEAGLNVVSALVRHISSISEPSSPTLSEPLNEANIVNNTIPHIIHISLSWISHPNRSLANASLLCLDALLQNLGHWTTLWRSSLPGVFSSLCKLAGSKAQISIGLRLSALRCICRSLQVVAKSAQSSTFTWMANATHTQDEKSTEILSLLHKVKQKQGDRGTPMAAQSVPISTHMEQLRQWRIDVLQRISQPFTNLVNFVYDQVHAAVSTGSANTLQELSLHLKTLLINASSFLGPKLSADIILCIAQGRDIPFSRRILRESMSEIDEMVLQSPSFKNQLLKSLLDSFAALKRAVELENAVELLRLLHRLLSMFTLPLPSIIFVSEHEREVWLQQHRDVLLDALTTLYRPAESSLSTTPSGSSNSMHELRPFYPHRAIVSKVGASVDETSYGRNVANEKVDLVNCVNVLPLRAVVSLVPSSSSSASSFPALTLSTDDGSFQEQTPVSKIVSKATEMLETVYGSNDTAETLLYRLTAVLCNSSHDGITTGSSSSLIYSVLERLNEEHLALLDERIQQENPSVREDHLHIRDAAAYLSIIRSSLHGYLQVVLTETSTKRWKKVCASCFQSPDRSSKKALLRCTRCRASYYCSVPCQRNHWPQHKVSKRNH